MLICEYYHRRTAELQKDLLYKSHHQGAYLNSGVHETYVVSVPGGSVQGFLHTE